MKRGISNEVSNGASNACVAIYQNCGTVREIKKAFAELNRQLDSKINAQAAELRSILLTESRDAKGEALEKTKADIEKYLHDVEYWSQFDEPEMDRNLYYWQIDNWGERIFGSHGTLFLGAFLDNSTLLFPVMLLCDEHGEYIDFTEDDIVAALEQADDSDVRFFKPTPAETANYEQIYNRLIAEVCTQHDTSVAPVIAYNERKIQNWVSVQLEQLQVQIGEARKEVEGYLFDEMMAIDSLQKKDIRKKLADAKKRMEALQRNYPKRVKEIQDDAQAEITRFNNAQAIRPILLINIVLKF